MDKVVKQQIIDEYKNSAEANWDKFNEDSEDNTRENKMNILVETISDRESYKDNSKSADDKDVNRNNKYYEEVTDNYNTYIEQMQDYFVSEYDKTLSDNTISDDDINKSNDKADLNKKKTNLEALEKTITDESINVLNSNEDKIGDYKNKIETLTKKYSDRVTAIEAEEKKKAEEEAAKKAEEERQAAEAAQNANQYQNNYSNNYGGGSNYNYSNGGNSGSSSYGPPRYYYYGGTDENGNSYSGAFYTDPITGNETDANGNVIGGDPFGIWG